MQYSYHQSDTQSPENLILLCSKELCTQYYNYCKNPSGELLLGNFIAAYFDQISSSYSVLCLCPDIPLGQINAQFISSSNGLALPRRLLEFISVQFIRIFTLNGHLIPIQYFNGALRHISRTPPLIFEFQHGWLVGKNIFKKYLDNSVLPDYYFVNDQASFEYLSPLSISNHIKLLLVPDLLILLQAHRHNSFTLPQSTRTLNILLCFTPRDKQLSYISSDSVSFFMNQEIPSVTLRLFDSLSRYSNISISLRGKPHDPNSHSHSNTLLQDLIGKHLVLSCISTVSIQSKFSFSIPSLWYFQHDTHITRKLLQFYPEIPNLNHFSSTYLDTYSKTLVENQRARRSWIPTQPISFPSLAELIDS